MTRFARLSLALSLCICGTAAAAPLNLVTNGSFEQGTYNIGSFQGWQTVLGDAATFVDSSGQTGTHYGQATDGVWAAYFGSTAASGGSSISQTLATTANQLYLLSFDLANDNGGLAASNSFVASVGGTPILTLTNFGSQNFVHEQFFFTATSAATTLRFIGSNDQSYAELDNVMVTAATPEPSSFVLLFTGMACLALAVRYTRTAGAQNLPGISSNRIG